MFGVFDGQGHPRTDTALHHVAGKGPTRPGPHCHRGTIPGILGRLAVRLHVCGQRFPLSAPIRDTGHECIGNPRSDAVVRCRHGSSTGIQDG